MPPRPVAPRAEAAPTGYALVLLAATLWGALPIGLRLLLDGVPGLTPLGLASLRALAAWLFLLAGLALLRPALLRPPARADLLFFLAHGLVGIAAFYVLYAEAVARAPVAVAVVLLYTSPAWVTLLAWRLHGERLTPRKLGALAATFLGAALVAGVADPSVLLGGANLAGVLAGLGSGLTWGLYSVLGKRSVDRYAAWTVLAYVLGIGTLALFTVQALVGGGAPPVADLGARGLLGLALLALGPTLGALAAYTAGLARLPASVASIVATWEPAMAALLGYLVFGELLGPSQVAGAVLILGGVLLLTLPTSRRWPVRARARWPWFGRG